MKPRTTQQVLSLLIGSMLVLMSGCGAPSTDQNTANKTPASNNTNSAVNASNSTPGTKVATTCTESDDKQIEQAIRISINEDADLRRQFKHINYDSKFCEIRLHGWIDTWANFKKLHERINGVDGVGKIHLLKFDVRSTSAAVEECRPPFKKCGELCIPEDDDCNIITDIAAGPAPYPSGTPK